MAFPNFSTFGTLSLCFRDSFVQDALLNFVHLTISLRYVWVEVLLAVVMYPQQLVACHPLKLTLLLTIFSLKSWSLTSKSRSPLPVCQSLQCVTTPERLPFLLLSVHRNILPLRLTVPRTVLPVSLRIIGLQ